MAGIPPAADGASLIDSQIRKDSVLPHQDRLNIAVFIDFDNIEIGVKTTLGQQFDVGIILDAIKERGEVVTKIAYADWTRAGEYSRSLTQHAIRLVQRNMTPGGDKNGADINLALDALEMAFTHQHINAYVIVGGDSDFLSLVEKLKQYDKKVFVVGGRAFTSMILQRNCHEFIAYENLAGVRKNAAKIGRPMPAAAASSPVAQAVPIVRSALKILADREVSPQTGLLKSTLLQLDSTFSERNYGASSFLDFVEKLSQAGIVSLKHAGRSVMVELNEGAAVEEASTAAHSAAPEMPSRPPTDVSHMFRAAEEQAARDGDEEPQPAPGFAPAPGVPSAAATDLPAVGEPAGGRPASRTNPRRRDDGALADVSAQREADPASGRWRLRRTALRVRGSDGPPESVSARRVRPDRARSPRRAARLPGTGDPEGGDDARAARDHGRRADRGPAVRADRGGRAGSARTAGDGADSDRHHGGTARAREAAQAARAHAAAAGGDTDAPRASGAGRFDASEGREEGRRRPRKSSRKKAQAAASDESGE